MHPFPYRKFSGSLASHKRGCVSKAGNAFSRRVHLLPSLRTIQKRGPSIWKTPKWLVPKLGTPPFQMVGKENYPYRDYCSNARVYTYTWVSSKVGHPIKSWVSHVPQKTRRPQRPSLRPPSALPPKENMSPPAAGRCQLPRGCRSPRKPSFGFGADFGTAARPVVLSQRTTKEATQSCWGVIVAPF